MQRLGTPHLCAALLALTFVAYLPVWQNDFVDFDDESFITTNPQVIQGFTGPGFRWAWTTFHGNYWQPLTWLTLQFDAQFFPSQPDQGPPVLSPAAFHGHNLLWHTGSVLLLFGLWQRLTGARWRSFLVAALFALHPMHVESVAWAAERKDVLSCFFGILTLWAYARYTEKPGWLRYLTLVGAFVLALLSKPMLMTLPVVLLLLDYWPLRRLLPGQEGGELARAATPLRSLVLEKLPLFALAAGIGLITQLARAGMGAPISLSEIPLSSRLTNALSAYGWYVCTTCWPVRLAVFYQHPGRDWSLIAVVSGTGILLATTALAVWQANRRRWLIVGWLWFAVALTPVIGLFQGGMQAWADRFSYWPHIGLFVASAWTVGELVDRWRVPDLVSALAGAVVLGFLGTLTWMQVRHWHDTQTLWHRVLAVTENNHRAHANLGRYHHNRAQLHEAARHNAAAVELAPDSPEYRYALGVTLLTLGRLEEAGTHFRKALDGNARYTDAGHNLGMVLLRQGKLEQALGCFRQVLELEPAASDALTGAGLVLWRQGKRREAIAFFQAALKLNPRDAEALHGLGLSHLHQGRTGMAIEVLDQAEQLSPGLVKASSDLGVALGRVGEWDRAARCHRQSLRLQLETESRMAALGGIVFEMDAIPRAVLFRCRLGFALHKCGYPLAANEEYAASLVRDPNWPVEFTAQAWKLATHPDADHRDPVLAHEMASQALEGIAGDPPASMLDVLAAALAAQGRFPEAVQKAQEALTKAAASVREAHLADTIRSRLQLYRAGNPYRDSAP